MRKNKAQKKGFTLVEMIVVVIILGILSALVLPKLFGTTVNAKASQTLSTFSNIEKYVIMQKRNNFADMTDIYDEDCNDVGGDGDYLNDLVCNGKIRYNSSLTDGADWDVNKNTTASGEVTYYIKINTTNPADKKVLEYIENHHSSNGLLVLD